MKPVIGESFVAKRDDYPNTYYVFKFVHSRVIDGETFFLGVKIGSWITLEHMNLGDSVWFNDDGVSIHGIEGCDEFYLTSKSKSKRD